MLDTFNRVTIDELISVSANEIITGNITTDELTSYREIHRVLDHNDSNNPLRSGSYRDDYLLTDLLPEQQVQINLESNDFDSYLQLINADTGIFISHDDDGGSGFNAQLNFTVADGINYLLRVTSFGSYATGPYTLSSNGGNFVDSINLSAGESISGELTDTDPVNEFRSGSFSDSYYLSDLLPGQLIQIDIDAEFDSYLQLLDAETGELIAYDDDSGSNLNSQLVFTAEEGIDYLVQVTSFAGNITGEYTLDLTVTSIDSNFSTSYGYGLVDATAAITNIVGQATVDGVTDLEANDLGNNVSATNQWGNDLIKVPEVWSQGFTGEGVVVAVIDSGVDIDHEDLAANIWINEDEVADDGIDNDGNGYVDDIYGWNFGSGQDNNEVTPGNDSDSQDHGTHVAGIIAAQDNDIGITGVAPDAELMVLRMGDIVTGDDGVGYYDNAGDLAAAIVYAVDNGANVINLSLAWNDSPGLEYALAYAADNDVITVSSAGNSGLDHPQQVPAEYATDYGITVGAVDSDGDLSSFSNLAGNDSDLQYVVAPGSSIYSTLPDDDYGYKSGTSMAAPYVSGVIALMLDANPDLTHDQVVDILTDSSISLV